MKLKQTLLFSSLLAIPQFTTVAFANDDSNKDTNVSYISNDEISKDDLKNLRDIKDHEKVKDTSTYKMVYKKEEKSSQSDNSKEKPNEVQVVNHDTTSKDNNKSNEVTSNENTSNNSNTIADKDATITKDDSSKKVVNDSTTKKVLPKTEAKILNYGIIAASTGFLAGATFYIIKTKNKKMLLVLLLASGSVAYGVINANAKTDNEIAPSEIVVAGQDLKVVKINGYEFLGVIEYNKDDNSLTITPKDSNIEIKATKKDNNTDQNVKKGSVIVHHVWTDGTEAYPTETIVDNKPVGTSYTSDYHKQDLGLWTKDGVRYNSIKDIFPNQTPNEDGSYAVNGYHSKFGYEGTLNFIKFHNVHDGYNTHWTCYFDKEENQNIYDRPDVSKQLEKMKNVYTTTESVSNSKLPEVLKNKLKYINTTGGVNSNAELYYNGVDPIQELKYVGTTSNSAPTSGEVKEGNQEITYIYDRGSYKVTQGYYVVCPTDHL